MKDKELEKEMKAIAKEMMDYTRGICEIGVSL